MKSSSVALGSEITAANITLLKEGSISSFFCNFVNNDLASSTICGTPAETAALSNSTLNWVFKKSCELEDSKPRLKAVGLTNS